jgi:hypothetical protein
MRASARLKTFRVKLLDLTMAKLCQSRSPGGSGRSWMSVGLRVPKSVPSEKCCVNDHLLQHILFQNEKTLSVAMTLTRRLRRPIRVSQPNITSTEREVTVSARVETDDRLNEFPENLWFSFLSIYADRVTGDLNGFAAALTPLAMTLGEDLYLEGVMSPKLLRGLHEYMESRVEGKAVPGGVRDRAGDDG